MIWPSYCTLAVFTEAFSFAFDRAASRHESNRVQSKEREKILHATNA